MIAIAKPYRRKASADKSKPAWHAGFAALLPDIYQQIRFAFCLLEPERREEAVQEALANTLVAYVRLHKLGKTDVAYATPLAKYAVRQVCSGRQVACPLNMYDVLSPYAQRKLGFTVGRLQLPDGEEGTWKEILVEDPSCTPAELAASRIDFDAWLKKLPRRKRRIASTLAVGETTKEAAKKHKVTPGRVSQVRRELTASWNEFQVERERVALAIIRLIRQDDIAGFDVHLTALKAELEEAVWRLDEHFAELKSAARERLGSLFNEGDYPGSLRGLFKIEWDFPSVEPPNYLRELSPELFRQEQARVAARFEEAVRLAEEAFTAELAKLVSHLTERITGQEDGKPKIFRDSAVENLNEFFDRFKLLNVRSNEQLDDLVAQAQRVIRGVEPQALRDSTSLRQQVATQLSGVQSVLDGLLVDRPRRNILRRPAK